MDSVGRKCKVNGSMAKPAGWRVGLALLGMMVCGVAAAQSASWNDHPALTDQWTFQLGAFFPKVDTTASLNGTGGLIGTSVSFEDDLGLSDSKTVPSILASVRLGERWRIEFEYFSLNRSAATPLSRTVNWGNNTYTVGTVVNSEFNSDIYRLAVGYSFVKDKQKEFGVALGLHATDFEAAIGTAGIGTAKGDALAPLPTIGVYGAYAFTPRWLLSGRLDYFSLNYGDYDGSLLNFNAGVDYRVTRNFGVGLGFRRVDYDVTATKTNYNGNVNYKFTGPMIYGVASF